MVIVFIPQNNDKLVEELQQEVSQLTASLQSAQAENGGLTSEVHMCIHTPVMCYWEGWRELRERHSQKQFTQCGTIAFIAVVLV